MFIGKYLTYTGLAILLVWLAYFVVCKYMNRKPEVVPGVAAGFLVLGLALIATAVEWLGERYGVSRLAMAEPTMAGPPLDPPAAFELPAVADTVPNPPLPQPPLQT